MLYYLGAGVPYPSVAYARLMIEGLMASFIFGFLGTAGPRPTSAPHLSPTEIGIVFSLDLLAAGAHTGGAHRLGDICFVICLFLFARMLLRRFRQRKDNPPPNFILVASGILSGIIGAALLAYSEAAHIELQKILEISGEAQAIAMTRWDRNTSIQPSSRRPRATD